MTALLLAAVAAIGTYLLVVPTPPDGTTRWHAIDARRRVRAMLDQAGLDDVSPRQFAVASVSVGLVAAVAAILVFGAGLAALLIGVSAACLPTAAWKRRRDAARRAARDAWPRLVEELRVLTGSAGRSIPQALIDVGLNGPAELRPAFRAAQREWVLTTDFTRMISVLKERLADPTADAVCETLLVAVDVGGDVDRRLAALAEDRRQDLADRKEALARQAGARLARWFVVVVPAGMAFAGLSVGEGQAAYRTSEGQLLVAAGVSLVAVCWWWASRVMRLPEPERVFDA